MSNLKFSKFDYGMNNLVPDTELVIESKRGIEGRYLRDATNTDILKGSVKRRPGVARQLAGTDCHSLWTSGDTRLFIDGSTLKALRGSIGSLSATTLHTGLSSGRRMSYAQVNDLVYMSNGVEILRLRKGVVEPATLPAGPNIGISGVTEADKSKFTRMACAAYEGHDGEVGPLSSPNATSTTGAIFVTVFSGALPAGATAIRVYASEPGGDAMRFAGRTSVGGSMGIGTGITGAIAPPQILAPLPPGDILAFLNARLYSASGATLSFSEPYMHGLYNPGRNYILFPAPITMVEPCQNGVYVSADQTYWIAGDPADAELNPVLPYRAIRGTSGPVPNENSCFWLSERGIVTGTQTGEVKNLQESNVATGDADQGAGLFRERDGIKQIITPVSGPQETGLAVRSWMDAEIVRKETTL